MKTKKEQRNETEEKKKKQPKTNLSVMCEVWMIGFELKKKQQQQQDQ